MKEKKNKIVRSNTTFLPKINSKEIKNNNQSINSEDMNLILNNNEPKENITNNNFNKEKRMSFSINSNNILFNKININISNLNEKALVSNKALQNIKDILFNKRPITRNKVPYYKKMNPIYFPNSPNIYSQMLYNSYNQIKKAQSPELINQNNSNSDINNIINNNSIIKNFNNSMTNFKNNSINNKINSSSIGNELNRSDAFNRSSSYLFSCLLNEYSKLKSKKIKKKSVYKNTIIKLSPFFKISKKGKVTARQIYRHYLRENAKDDGLTEKNKISTKFNGSYDYSHVICPGLKNIYGNNKNYMNMMNEIKKNNFIAYKKDFNIKDYQKTLIKLMKKNVSEKYLDDLKKNYMKFNEKNYGMIIPKGRYINLANKLKEHLSGDCYENLRKMDKNYKLYFEKKSKSKKEEQNRIIGLNKKLKFKKINRLIK